MQYRVDSADTAQAALDQAGPGDRIMVSAGTYLDWKVTASCTGTVDSPVVIQAEEPGPVVLSGASTFVLVGGSVVVQGFRFSNCRLTESCVVLDGASGCRVTGCTFRRPCGEAPVIMVRGTTADGRVDHCRFLEPEARSVQVFIEAEESPVRTRIDHNLFQDVPPIPSGNGRETIQIGQSQPRWGWVSPLTVVEHNTFLRCDGEIEIISNKASHNVYRRNWFKDCKGELVMRGGSYCEITENRFENCTGGIRLSGMHHRVVNNVIANCKVGIRLRYGMTRELGGAYQAVGHCLLANNTIVDAETVGLHVGAGKDTDAGEKGVASIAPYGNEFIRNIVTGSRGVLVKIEDAPENRITGNVFWSKGEAAAPDVDGNVLDEPRFIDATTGDYRLAATTRHPTIGAPGRPMPDQCL